MPFTFSHPAIVLPLKYLPPKWISWTGLIIGSMTPDFEYFIRMKIQSHYSHTIRGLWFDIALGILLTFIYHNLVRNSLFDNLPRILRGRFEQFRHFNWNENFKRNWPVIIISITIGVVSHLFWDSFTHTEGHFARDIPFLTYQFKMFGLWVSRAEILQHTSTLAGAFIIVLVVWKMPVDESVVGKISLKYWGFVMLLSSIIITARLLGGLGDDKFYGNLIVTVIAAVLISLAVTPLLIGMYSDGKILVEEAET